MLTRIRPFLVLVTGLILFAPAPGYAADSSFKLMLRWEAREIEVWHGANRILVYTFGSDQFKPYVRELFCLEGINVLRDGPADHLHHHGLMYAIQVNGINFWEEAGNAGWQIPRPELTRQVKRHPHGSDHARFSQIIHWVSPDAAQFSDSTPFALLIETRTLTVTVDPGTEEIAIQWQSDFEVGQATPGVTLTGATYHGLGLRLAAEFDLVARRQNSAGVAFAEEGGDQVIPAHWVAASQEIAGRVYTVALFHHPSNAGLARVFSMVNPFAYLSATQGLDETPLEYERGDTFTVQHLVTLTPRRLTDETLEGRYQRWIE